jgi:large subunit ribosomal protein L20
MRTIKGAARAKAKRKLFKRAKGYVGGRGRLLRSVKETLIRAGVYAFRDRRAKKRNFRRLWITRLSAACQLNGMNYSRFMAGLKKANVVLDRKSLSEIAVRDPAAFTVIAQTAKAALQA